MPISMPIVFRRKLRAFLLFFLILFSWQANAVDETKFRAVLRAYADFNSLSIGVLNVEAYTIAGIPAAKISPLTTLAAGFPTAAAVAQRLPKGPRAIDRRYDIASSGVTTLGGVTTIAGFTLGEQKARSEQGMIETFRHTKAYLDLKTALGEAKAIRLTENLAHRWSFTHILQSEFAGQDRKEITSQIDRLQRELAKEQHSLMMPAAEQRLLSDIRISQVMYAEVVSTNKSENENHHLGQLLADYKALQGNIKLSEGNSDRTVYIQARKHEYNAAKILREILDEMHQADLEKGFQFHNETVVFVSAPPKTPLGALTKSDRVRIPQTSSEHEK